jgi:hypothetical protein
VLFVALPPEFPPLPATPLVSLPPFRTPSPSSSTPHLPPCSKTPSARSTMSSAKKPVAPPSSTTPSRPPGSSSSNTSTPSNKTAPMRPPSKGKNTPSPPRPPYRWEKLGRPQDPAGKLDHHRALSGDDLIDFVDQQALPLPPGFQTKAAGPDTIEYKIGEIFGEMKNKIQSGYNLREIIDPSTAPLPLPDREARALAPLRSQDQEHGQRRPQRRRVLHPAPAHPRHDPVVATAHRRNDLRRRRAAPPASSAKPTTISSLQKAHHQRPESRSRRAPSTARRRSPSPTSSPS